MNFPDYKRTKGFTLIELLVVIGILAILLAVTLIAINPARQFASANDTQRRSDIKAILDAVNQYNVEQKGDWPLGVEDGTTKQIAAPAGSANTDLCFQLVTKYMAAMPTDPMSGHNGKPLYPCPADYNTEYTIRRDGDRITVSAPLKELAPQIEITR